MTPLTCRGCGAVVPGDATAIFRCPNAGHDAGDHVLGRDLEESDGPFPGREEPKPVRPVPKAHVRPRGRCRHGMADAEFVELVGELDAAVKRVSGRGFVETPLRHADSLAGGTWVKDETGNVSGSHKARHLMGLAILGKVRSRVGLVDSASTARLAIASCGNAALAAAVIARAWDRPLDVFIPPDASAGVVKGLVGLGATVHLCPRTPDVTGDPCYHAFVSAVHAGAVPFCCQGNENGLTIEGGETLGWEVISALAEQGRQLNRLFVQVGGGALASSCLQAFRDARALGVGVTVPRIHAVQTRGGHPLREPGSGSRPALRPGSTSNQGPVCVSLPRPSHRARATREVQEELEFAARHRSEFMWAWESEPVSIAHGILDDETYDWLAIIRGMIDTGGFPLVVGEERLVEANRVGRAATGIDVDETGSSGLAGLLESVETDLGAPQQASLVIFSGVRR